MIEYKTGDMFQSKAECMLNTVNCEGYMGKGIAYQFKIQFPENNKAYVKACKTGELKPGKVHVFVENGVTIVNFPTKDKWREKSKLSYIEDGLDAFLETLPKLHVETIAVPPLGCGNGGLDWRIVKGIIEKKLNATEGNYQFLIYEPGRSYAHKAKVEPKLSVSSLIIMKLKIGLKKQTKLRLQKAAYFMNVFAGEAYFKFQKYKYGPYAHSIDVISRNIGEYQNFYDIKDTEMTYNKVYQTICSEKTTKVLNRLSPAVDRAVQYVNQIESDEYLEGVSTALYLIDSQMGKNEEQLIQNFKNWSEDKASRFSETKIRECINFLEKTGMIEKNITGDFTISEYKM